MNQAYVLIFSPRGYMMAELTDLSTTERGQFLDEVSVRHPISVVDLDEDSVQVRHLDNLHIIENPDCDLANVVEVCNLVLRHYKVTEGFEVYPLDFYVDKDMNTQMIDLDIPSILSDPVLESVPDSVSDPIFDSDTERTSESNLETIGEDIEVLKEQVAELSLLVKRMAVQYGVLMGPRS